MHMLIAQQLPMPQVSNSFFPLNPSLAEEMKRLFANLTIIEHVQSVPNVEDVMEEFRHNGRDYEYCPDNMDSAIEAAPNPRRKKIKKLSPTECVFCRNNGERESYYKEHVLKDAEGRVRCPVLRRYTCPICGASGDNAHTIKYCSQNSAYNSAAGITSTVNAFKFLRNSSGRRRTK